jgi:Spy/CpxP family protein refolding chaperone
MKKITMPRGLSALLVGGLLSLSFALSAQGPPPPDAPRRGERIKALRAAFITQQLDLTEKEAQAFWPVFNEYQEKIKAINDGTHKQLKKGMENLSDAELEKLLDQELANEEKIVALKREYLPKFKGVLPIRKVARLSLVEKQFRMEVLKRVKEGPRGDGRGPGKGPGGNGGGRRN